MLQSMGLQSIGHDRWLSIEVVLVEKNSPINAGSARDVVWITELGRSPRGGNGNPLQHSGLENPMDRGAWGAIVHRVAESDTTEVI